MEVGCCEIRNGVVYKGAIEWVGGRKEGRIRRRYWEI